MEEFFALFVNSFAPVLGTAMTVLVSWGTIELTRYVRSKTKNETANAGVKRICDMARTTVAELNQTLVPAMRKVAADGKLTQADAAYLKKLALEKVKKQIPIAIEQAANLAVNSISALAEAEIEKAIGETKGGLK